MGRRGKAKFTKLISKIRGRKNGCSTKLFTDDAEMGGVHACSQWVLTCVVVTAWCSPVTTRQATCSSILLAYAQDLACLMCSALLMCAVLAYSTYLHVGSHQSRPLASTLSLFVDSGYWYIGVSMMLFPDLLVCVNPVYKQASSSHS